MKHFTVITFYPLHILTIARIKIEFINAIKIILTIIMDFFSLNSNFSRNRADREISIKLHISETIRSFTHAKSHQVKLIFGLHS